MNKIEELKLSSTAQKYGVGHLKDCVDWAVERLVKVEEDDDMDIFLLAGSTEERQIEELVQAILRRYLDPDDLNDELCAGQLLVRLYDNYHSNAISIKKLDPVFWSMMYDLWPSGDWLVMLCRNCELATFMDNFMNPFEIEFKYLTDLWKEAKSVDDFRKSYDRKISNTHDFGWRV